MSKHLLIDDIILFLYLNYSIPSQMKQIVQSYLKNGYAIVPGFMSAGQCDEAVKQINRLIDSFEIKQDQLTVFDTDNRQHDLSQYFKKSADQVSFFFEKKAFENGKLVKPKNHAINKIGHALHQKNQIFKKITYTKSIHQICKQLNILDPVVVQSMTILKPPQIGGQVPDHQDSTFLFDDPLTLVAFWIPLQDATLNNGCLWGIPGSHKGKLYKRHKVVDGKTWDQVLHQKDWKPQDFVPLEMKKGDLVFFSGKFIHRSNENNSLLSRYAYTWHLRDSKTKWSAQNWLQRKDFPKFPLNLDY